VDGSSARQATDQQERDAAKRDVTRVDHQMDKPEKKYKTEIKIVALWLVKIY